jgi:hypothetical protein
VSASGRTSKDAELKLLRERITVTLRFIDEAEDLGDFGREILRKTDELFAKRSLGGLKLIAKQVDAFMIGLTQDQRDGLEAILKARIGVDREAERARGRDEVAQILTKGRIDSEKQRRRLEDYLEALESTGEDAAEAAAIRRLLSS